MARNSMRKDSTFRGRPFPPTSIVLSLFLFPLLLSSALGQGPRPFPDPAEAEAAKRLVLEFHRFGSNRLGLNPDSIGAYAIDWFQEYLTKRSAEPFWPTLSDFSVDNVYKIYETDSAAIVTSRTWPDSLPYFGRFTVDWTWFVRKNEAGEWRIAYVRRMEGMEKGLDMLRLLDTTTIFPDRIKPDIARESSNILLSNEQMRQEFNANRSLFDTLARLASTYDSIRFIERTGDRISQFNMVMIDWGMASEEVPQEVIDDYMAKASAAEREEMEVRLRTAQKQKEEGDRTLQKYARKAGLTLGILEDVVALMKKTRVKFINTDLNWDGAVLMTIAGNVNDAMGYFYSPKGELPLISPEEFFYLEDLGNGWWIFRAT